MDKILQLAIKEANQETKEFMKEFYLDSLDFMHYPIETIRILSTRTQEIEELNRRYYEFRSKYE